MKFYERRARRILPALFIVIVTCIPLSLILMSPDQLKSFFKSVMASSLSVSNILFWQESGHFAREVHEKPLIHTWSLGVEEQYYMLFPVLLIALYRFKIKRAIWLVIGLAAASFVLSEWGWRNRPDANFFLLPTRAWEILAGSICAFLLAGREPATSNFLSILGLALVLTAVFLYSSSTPMPSAYALSPVLGTCLVIIFSGPTTVAKRLLSSAPLVGVGLVSYSSYLWHQPLFAFSRLLRIEAPPAQAMLALVLASLVLGWATWRIVERPFRRPSAGVSTTKVVCIAGASSFGFAVFGLAMLSFQSLIDGVRFTTLQKQYFDTAIFSPHRNDSHSHRSEKNYRSPKDACVYFSNNVKVAVLGDSHAVELSYELAKELNKQGIGVKDFSLLGGYPSYIGVDSGNNCAKWTAEAIDFISHNSDIKYVVVDYRIVHWINVLNEADVAASLENILAKLSETKTVIYVLQPPELPKDINEIIVQSWQSGGKMNGGTESSWHLLRSKFDFSLLEHIRDNYEFVDTTEIFCADGTCKAGENGESFYHDYNHLSLAGAKLVALAVIAILADKLRSR